MVEGVNYKGLGGKVKQGMGGRFAWGGGEHVSFTPSAARGVRRS
jgi:hypothetical protein